jgi:hypothetical protein
MIKKIASVVVIIAFASLFTQSAMAFPTVPDVSATPPLLAIAICGLAAARRFFR